MTVLLMTRHCWYAISCEKTSEYTLYALIRIVVSLRLAILVSANAMENM